MDSDRLVKVVSRFKLAGNINDIREFGSGNINDTFLVTLKDCSRVILQRINSRVFHSPQLLMDNLRIVTKHIKARLKQETVHRRWEIPCIVSTLDGTDWYKENDGSFWRIITYIDQTKSVQVIKNVAQAREAGYALGRFQRLVSDLDAAKLFDPLYDFHITPRYLAYYDEVLRQRYPKTLSADIRYCLRLIQDKRAGVHLLEEAKQKNILRIRPIHGDPKLANILFDTSSDQAVSIIDLDTVKPGLIQYDVGDALRSCCNLAGEETNNLNEVNFNIDICRLFLEGYFSEAKIFLTDKDYEFIYDAVRIISFELGLRFFTDFLEKNRYFRVRNAEQNLMKSIIQFKLSESIEANKPSIIKMIAEMRA